MARNSPKHCWREDQRVALSLLEIYYGLTSKEITAIFNILFSTELLDEGFYYGFPCSSVKVQLNDLKNGRHGSGTYKEVVRTLDRVGTTTYRSMFEKISTIAKNLGINTKSALQPPLPSTKSPRRRLDFKATPARSCTPYVPSTDDGSSASESTPTPRRPRVVQKVYGRVDSVRKVRRHPDRRLPLLRLRWDAEGKTGQQRPTLLFRQYETAHGLTARRFVQGAPITIPPPLESDDFRGQVLPHLAVQVPYASPFMSLAENPRNALGRVRLTDEHGWAVLEYNAIEADARARWRSGLYLVPKICQTHQLQGLPRAYTGTGEFLAWGSIDCQPIASFTAAEAIFLRSIMTTVSKASLDYESGLRLGRALTKVPDDWKEIVCYKLIRAYNVPGYTKGPYGAAYDAFIQGVYAVTGGDRAASVMRDTDLEADMDMDTNADSPESRADDDPEHNVSSQDDEIIWIRDDTDSHVYHVYDRKGVGQKAGEICGAAAAVVQEEDTDEQDAFIPRSRHARRQTFVDQLREYAAGTSMHDVIDLVSSDDYV